MDDVAKEFDALEEIRLRTDRVDRILQQDRAKESFRMRDIADTMHIRVLHLSGASCGGKRGQERHVLLNEALEEGHRHKGLNALEPAQGTNASSS